MIRHMIDSYIYTRQSNKHQIGFRYTVVRVFIPPQHRYNQYP